MRLLLTGGGTGGHVYPALAIAEGLRAEPALAPLDVLFVGTRRGLEASIVPAAGLRTAFVSAAPLVRKPSFAFFKTMFANVAGFVQSLGVLHRFKPDFAIATGGYVAFPVIAALRFVRALRRSRAPIALLEPNAAPGLTNRLLGPLVDEIWLSFAPVRPLLAKESVTGTPVRDSFLHPLDRAEARTRLGLARELTTIVIFGGSQGARSLNEATLDLAASLPADRQILLVAGTRDYAALTARAGNLANGRLHIVPYLEDPRPAYAAADVVVARAGASTLGELAATGTPALLVPYPHATDDHQRYNAEAVAGAGAARVLADADLNAVRLRSELDAMLEPGTLAQLRANATRLGAADPRAAIAARVKQRFRPNGQRP